jgi:FKBP-type peptidyl-prolyl cis-trans isomerase
MKIQSLILSIAVLALSCNTQPKADNNHSDSTKLATDTTGLADYQAWKAQNELTDQNTEEQQKQENKASSSTVKKSTSVKSENTSSSNTSTSNSTSGTTQKKGWSKTAKGAVVGGVVGATTGAVINKKNRAAGAVIGGVIGAGTGAVIGNEMDKKDGRH